MARGTNGLGSFWTVLSRVASDSTRWWNWLLPCFFWSVESSDLTCPYTYPSGKPAGTVYISGNIKPLNCITVLNCTFSSFIISCLGWFVFTQRRRASYCYSSREWRTTRIAGIIVVWNCGGRIDIWSGSSYPRRWRHNVSTTWVAYEW